MYKFDFQKRIRYGETDQMGYLYYGNYPLLYEIGRVETIRSLGLSYKQLEDECGVMMPVLALQARYKAPLLYDENCTIATALLELPEKMATFQHQILNEAGKVVHTAEVKLFYIDMVSNKRVSAPDLLLSKLRPYFD